MGFIQPDELPSLLSDVDAFILPSTNEHYGVVVHEAALMSKPIIISDTVYSKYDFVIDGYNGFVYETESIKSLKNSLLKQV